MPGGSRRWRPLAGRGGHVDRRVERDRGPTLPLREVEETGEMLHGPGQRSSSATTSARASFCLSARDRHRAGMAGL